MRSALAAWPIVICMGLCPVFADVIEIPLPDLHGVYPYGGESTRTAAFLLDPAPSVVHTAWFRLSYSASIGTVECDGGGQYPWPVEFGASIMDPNSAGWWSAWSVPPEIPGSFTWTAEFKPSLSNPPSWNFLSTGQGEISLFGAPTALIGICAPITPPPEGTVEEAVLIVDAEFPIPSRSETWGRIKALYSD